MANRGSRGIALHILDHGTRRGWRVSVTPRPLFTPGKNPVPIVQEAGWAPGPVWKGVENLAPTGIRSRDRPARSQSLYQPRYPARRRYVDGQVNFFFLSNFSQNKDINFLENPSSFSRTFSRWERQIDFTFIIGALLPVACAQKKNYSPEKNRILAHICVLLD